MKISAVFLAVFLFVINAMAEETISISGKAFLYNKIDHRDVQVIVRTKFKDLNLKTVEYADTVFTTAAGEYHFTFPNPKTILGETIKSYSFQFSKDGYVTIDKEFAASKNFTMQDVMLGTPADNIVEPSICIVTRDSISSNVLVAWSDVKDATIAQYTIYRSLALGDIPTPIGSVSKGNRCIFEDRTSNEYKNAFYYLQYLYKNGSRSSFSSAKKSIYLEAMFSQALDKKAIVDLRLDAFEGIDLTDIKLNSHTLYRSSDGANFTLVEKIEDVTAISVFELTDVLSTPGKWYYRMSIEYPYSCSVSPLKTDSGPFSQSITNLAEITLTQDDFQEPGQTPIRSIDKQGLIVGNAFVADRDGFLTVCNAIGKVMVSRSFKAGTYSLSLPDGVYFASWSAGSSSRIYRFVVDEK